jgi:hypothetical protein
MVALVAVRGPWTLMYFYYIWGAFMAKLYNRYESFFSIFFCSCANLQYPDFGLNMPLLVEVMV